MFHHTHYDRTIAATHDQNMWMRMALSRTKNESMGGAVLIRKQIPVQFIWVLILHI